MSGKLPPIQCGTCGNEFRPHRENNIYCKRKCFKQAYYQRKKAEEKELSNPIYKCPICRTQQEITFNIMKDKVMWDEYICTNCKVPRITLMRSQDL